MLHTVSLVLNSTFDIVGDVTGTSDETSNDLLLAQMLQLEFDKENDAYVKSLEKTYNGTSKGMLLCNRVWKLII